MLVLLELEFLYEIGKITVLPMTVFGHLAEGIQLEICRRDFQEVVKLAIQQTWTRDPFDRLITAQAALQNDIFITKDRLIHDNYTRATW